MKKNSNSREGFVMVRLEKNELANSRKTGCVLVNHTALDPYFCIHPLPGGFKFLLQFYRLERFRLGKLDWI